MHKYIIDKNAVKCYIENVTSYIHEVNVRGGT